MTDLAVPSFKAWRRYTNFSVSVRLDRSCTATSNCSQKVFQFKMLPSKTGTSSFGSLTPSVSETEGEGEERERNSLRISRPQSNWYFSTRVDR